jgi:sugar lactone lactonase YvrE
LKLVLLAGICVAQGDKEEAADLSGFSTRTGLEAPRLQFLRAFSLGGDVKAGPSTSDRIFDLLAGTAPKGEPESKGMMRPHRVTTDSRQRVIVTDPGAHAVHVFDFENRKYSRIEGGPRGRLQSPAGVAVDAEDNIYVTDTKRGLILIYDSGGKFLRYLGQLQGDEAFYQRPTSITIDRRSGNMYVVDAPRHYIFMLDSKGNVLARFGKRGGGSGPGEFKYPTETLVNGDELVVLDAKNSRIQVLGLDGTFRREISTLGHHVSDISLAVDSRQNFYVLDKFLNKIDVLNRNWKLLDSLGQRGSAPGQFAVPAGIWVDSQDRIYVADTNNHRVQVFQFGATTGQEANN